MMSFSYSILLTIHTDPMVPNRIPSREGKIMMKKFWGLMITALFLLGSCTSFSKENLDENPDGKAMEQVSELMFDLTPSEGKLYFFTLVTRKQFRDREIAVCREEASRQLSRYFQINGVSYSRTDESVRGTAKKEATGIAFNDDRAQTLVDDLEEEKIIQTEDFTAAVFSYSKAGTFSLPYKPGMKDGHPDWIYSSVKIPGYQTSVGFTGPSRYLARTLQQADKNALATLLEQRNGSMDITQSDWQTEWASSSRSSMVETSAGSIQNAYILSRWMDDNGNFYSLAVCPLP